MYIIFGLILFVASYFFPDYRNILAFVVIFAAMIFVTRGIENEFDDLEARVGELETKIEERGIDLESERVS